MKTFKKYYTDVILKQYGDISGRTTKKQYWFFILFWLLIWFAVMIITIVVFVGILGVSPRPASTQNPFMSYGGITYCLLTFIPFVALIVRRLHDAGSSGLWAVLVLVPGLGLFIVIGIGLLSGTPIDQYSKYGPPKSQ